MSKLENIKEYLGNVVNTITQQQPIQQQPIQQQPTQQQPITPSSPIPKNQGISISNYTEPELFKFIFKDGTNIQTTYLNLYNNWNEQLESIITLNHYTYFRLIKLLEENKNNIMISFKKGDDEYAINVNNITHLHPLYSYDIIMDLQFKENLINQTINNKISNIQIISDPIFIKKPYSNGELFLVFINFNISNKLTPLIDDDEPNDLPF